MNRLAGAKQASFHETSCLLQNHVLWIKCSKTSDKPMILPWAIIANGWEMGLGHSNPCSEPRKVHRNQILVNRNGNAKHFKWITWGALWPISSVLLTIGALGSHIWIMWPFSLIGQGGNTWHQKDQSEAQLTLWDGRIRRRQTDSKTRQDL